MRVCPVCCTSMWTVNPTDLYVMNAMSAYCTRRGRPGQARPGQARPGQTPDQTRPDQTRPRGPCGLLWPPPRRHLAADAGRGVRPSSSACRGLYYVILYHSRWYPIIAYYIITILSYMILHYYIIVYCLYSINCTPNSRSENRVPRGLDSSLSWFERGDSPPRRRVSAHFLIRMFDCVDSLWIGRVTAFHTNTTSTMMLMFSTPWLLQAWQMYNWTWAGGDWYNIRSEGFDFRTAALWPHRAGHRRKIKQHTRDNDTN